MRLEFEPNSSTAATFVEKEMVAQDVSAELDRMFREGVRAAQEGNRSEARNLLLRVTESDADNENAWLWLASISEYPEELLVFLNNVLRINPHNERALEWNAATKSLLAKTLVQRGMDAVQDNRQDFARQCFEQALEHEAENEMAWLWMATIADAEDEKAACFEKVLSVNPANEHARASLASIRSQKTRQMFRDALATAFDGAHAEAKEMLAEVLERDAEMADAWVLKSHLANSFEERAEALLKVRALDPENEMAKAVLASWRNLSEKLAAAPSTAESSPAAVHEFAPAHEPADFSEEKEAAAESEAAPQFADEAEPAAQFNTPQFDAPANFAPAEEEEAASFDAPTQDLSFEEDFRQPEAPAVDSVEERQTEEVHFETAETAEAADFEEAQEKLKAELEAEEAEMHWAFSSPQESRDVEDYFRADDDDDIHKTQQANYEPQDFTPPASAEAASADAEMTEATPAASREDWRDTSPTVFVNYSPAMPESALEAQTVQFSYTENHAEEMPVAAAMPETEERFEAPMNFEEAPQMNFENDFAPPATDDESAGEAVSTAAAESAEEIFGEASAATPKAESVLCPFCDAENEKQAFSCGSCQTVLTLSDLEMLLSQQNADQEKLRLSVESLERENESYGLGVEQMMNLGVGHVNLKNYRQGFFYLQEAVRMNPSNVLLDAQVNALAIRLSEMEEQQSAHDLLSKNRRILVVDDSPTVRKLISGKLEKCGHEVVCAIDGVDALEKIKELKPDLVLLDITMPRMDGYQVCKMIRSNDSTKDVPVVMISGKDGFFDKVRGRMAGTSGYITKPFGPETLMKTVETYLN